MDRHIDERLLMAVYCGLMRRYQEGKKGEVNKLEVLSRYKYTRSDQHT
jgi:hypothetical protein